MIRQRKFSKCFEVCAIHLNRLRVKFLLAVLTYGLLTVCGLLSVDCGLVFAAEKNWDAGGDGATWADDDNWYPGIVPSLSDDAVIDTENATVICDRTFNAKSITIGGRETSTLTINDFVYGTVQPDSTSNVAILNRSKATVTLKGAGILTLKGQYKDSEESLTAEPSFIFWIE